MQGSWTYTIKVTLDSGTGFYQAHIYDEKENVLAVGLGRTGPLDAASNAAIHASNAEYRIVNNG